MGFCNYAQLAPLLSENCYGRAEREAGASLVDCDGIRNDEPDGPGTNSSNLFQRAKDLRVQLIQSISKTRGGD